MISSRFNLNEKSQVVEIASNDGYLLQFFKKMNIPCYGIEPTESTAIESKKKGIKMVLFDRGGYVYHGKIKSFADGAREGGLIF